MPKLVRSIKLNVIDDELKPCKEINMALGKDAQKFIQQFNDRFKTGKDVKTKREIVVVVNLYDDKTFDFVKKGESVSAALKRVSGITKCSGTANKTECGEIKYEEIVKIAEEKMKGVGIKDKEDMIKSIEGTAKSMGLRIKKNESC